MYIKDINDKSYPGTIEVVGDTFDFQADDDDADIGLHVECKCNSWFEIDDENHLLYLPNPGDIDDKYYIYNELGEWEIFKDE